MGTKSLDTMIANEKASAFTDTKVNSDELIKSNGFDSSETSESINKNVSNDTSIISTKEATPLKKLAVENVSKNGEILPKEKNEDNIKNGGDESLGKKSEDEKVATKNSVVVETEKETSQQNSVEKKTEKEKTTSTTKEVENNDNNKEKIQN